MAQMAEGSPVDGLVAVVEQLVQDVAEDAEVYQQAFPDSSPVSLPAISARWALQLKKLLLLLALFPELHAVPSLRISGLQQLHMAAFQVGLPTFSPP